MVDERKEYPSPPAWLRPRVSYSFRLPRRVLRLLSPFKVINIVLFLIIVAVFFPSYTSPPSHYADLELRITSSTTPGRGNLRNEKVFIAISLYDPDGALMSGQYGQNLLEVIDLLGPANVFLSIYENDGEEAGQKALMEFERNLPIQCQRSLFSDKPSSLDVSKFERGVVTMPSGERRLKRIAYLAEVRNRALRPLDRTNNGLVFDKVLFLNDVFFDPIDVIHLLFSTNQNPATKEAVYISACAADYAKFPAMFYDGFATRDAEGYEIGEVLFPYFSSKGKSLSRSDILSGRDSVRVKSCWSGMVAVQAKYLQNLDSKLPDSAWLDVGSHTIDPDSPSKQKSEIVRFRSEPDIFYDACECCLFHADLSEASDEDWRSISSHHQVSVPIREHDVGIYMNPYVRVAYRPDFLKYIHLFQRFERLFQWLQSLISWLRGFPRYNPYCGVEYRDTNSATFEEEVYDSQSKAWTNVTRPTRPGLFCGVREMHLMKSKTGHRAEDANWEEGHVPRGSIWHKYPGWL